MIMLSDVINNKALLHSDPISSAIKSTLTHFVHIPQPLGSITSPVS